MKNMRFVLLGLLFLFCGMAYAETSVTLEKDDLDVKDVIFSHIEDSYEWHIATWGDFHFTIPLPIIVKSENSGWQVFLSSRVGGAKVYKGFYIAEEGKYTGKIVERNASGAVVRPLDISLTKTSFALIFNSLVLVVIMLSVSRWYKNKTPEHNAPRGLVGLMEMCVIMIYDDVIKGCVGKDYKRFAPYLLTVFFFIFFNNILGLIPIFPGGANVTGNIAVTMVLSVCTFLAINLFGSREYWKEILWPDVPMWLKVPFPLMPIVEIFGIFTKPFALMIRLFANIMAGHSVILALTCLVFITASMGPAINSSMTVLSVIFSVFMNLLELLVAFIQAYVFTMLSAVFIGLARSEEEPEKAKRRI